MNTSRKRSDHFLVKTGMSARQIEGLLVEWANAATSFEHFQQSASAGTKALKRFMAKYQVFFDSIPTAVRSETAEWTLTDAIQKFLRLAWDAPDLRSRLWFIFEARRAYHQITAVIPVEYALSQATGDEWKRLAGEFTAINRAVPAMSPFEQVAFHFHLIAEKACHCANPECPAPYFFAAKKGQKYCTSKCSAPSQRDQKRRWWRENRAKKGRE